jgi:hypothetical protein
MFEKFKAKRASAQQAHAAQKAQQAAASQAASWQAEHDGAAALLREASSPGGVPEGLVLHKGEGCVGTLTDCGLIEEQRGRGSFVAGSQGVSIPIGSIGGKAIRYHVGATKGHYEQGKLAAQVVATGTLYITDQRLIFTGPTQTRECAFTKLVAVNRDDQAGTLTISVSNRQKPTVISFGPAVSGWVGFHVDLALSRWRGDDDQFIEHLKANLAEIDARRPPAVQPDSVS